MTDSTIVRIAAGPVAGVVEAGVRRFSGIPFATAARFRRPAPVSWDGTFDANRWGPAPWQPLPAFDEPGAPFDEDCLNAAVWAPAEIRSPLPVLVWVYGGGFEFGSNASPLTRGDALAATGDMVVVGLNYRIGALGWAELSHLGGELSEASNLGLRDLIAGLRWVRENIAAFGGDPDRITVMGESAGSFALCALLGVPGARDLFTSLAAFSGCASRVIPLAQARSLGETILAGLGGDPSTASPEAWIAAQRAAIPRDLGVRNAARAVTLGVVDDSHRPGALLAQHPLAAVEAAAWGERRMLIGTTRDEATHFPHPDGLDEEGLRREVADWTVDARGSAIADAYVAAECGDIVRARRRALTDWIYRLPSVRLADAVTANGGRAYLSIVGRVEDTPAPHGVDVPGLFARSAPGDSPAAVGRAREITRAIRAFVADDMPWGPWMADGGPVESFGEPDFDGMSEYLAVRGRWQDIPRP